MINRRTKFYVGLFMAAGLAVAVVAIIWLGMSRFFEKGHYYAVYFDESVQGLTVDAPVKYRGVTIGRVEKIAVAADSRLIEVVMKIETDLRLVRDLTAQLKVVGITGSMFIELDRRKEGEEIVSPKLKFPTEYPVLASRPSDISELFRGIDEIVQKINTLDLPGISDRMKVALDRIDQAMVDADLKGVSGRTREVLDRLDRSLADLDLKGISDETKNALTSLNRNLAPERWEQVIVGVEETIVSLNRTVENANQLVANAVGVVDTTRGGVEIFNQHLFTVGQDLEKAGDNLNLLLEQINDQPARMLFGEPPPRRLPFEESGRQ